MGKERVLVICVHNSARSQMAEEYIRLYGGDIAEVTSAGLEPGSVNPIVVELLREEGIDISGKETQSVFELHESGRAFDWVIAVCDLEAKERCPIFPAEKKRLHWPFADPSAVTGTDEERTDAVREIRNEIRQSAKAFVDSLRAAE
jgi:arsenate reductase